MTKYCGGKKKIAKSIYDTIRCIEDRLIDMEAIESHLDYIEPFCGMCSVGMKFATDEGGVRRKIIISDFNEDITSFWKGLKSGNSVPKFISETEYNKLKQRNGSSFAKTYVGFDWSFGGGWFAGYIGRYHTFDETKKIGLGCYNKMETMKPVMERLTINETTDYRSYIPHNMLIYLDPPYSGGKKRTDFLQNFDSDEFWAIATKWSKDNIVFISEVSIPDKYKDLYTIVWSGKTQRSVSLIKGEFKMECLFLHNYWVGLTPAIIIPTQEYK